MDMREAEIKIEVGSLVYSARAPIKIAPIGRAHV
jgi:hypothetical protein